MREIFRVTITNNHVRCFTELKLALEWIKDATSEYNPYATNDTPGKCLHRVIITKELLD